MYRFWTMLNFFTSTADLRKRLEALESERISLRREWENAQLEIIELTRRASNALKSLAREARHAEIAREKLDETPGVDPISAAILKRRQRGLQAASGQ